MFATIRLRPWHVLSGALTITALFGFRCERGDSRQHGSAEQEVGGLSLGVRLADHSEVSKVSYTVSRHDEEVRAGEIAVDDRPEVAAQVANLHAGDGYRVDMSADRKFVDPCRAVVNFEVEQGVVTPLPVIFQCESSEPQEP